MTLGPIWYPVRLGAEPVVIGHNVTQDSSHYSPNMLK